MQVLCVDSKVGRDVLGVLCFILPGQGGACRLQGLKEGCPMNAWPAGQGMHQGSLGLHPGAFR